jgi:hypothetical protein
MIYHIYCDESRQTKDRYMVLGGLIIEQTELAEFKNTMQRYRRVENMHAELKWNRVSNQKLAQYEKFMEYFFALNNTDIVHFHSIILDNHQINHKKFNRGDKELGFYKFYYQLLLNCFGKWYCNKRTDVKFIVHLDQRTTKYKLDNLKRILNYGMNKQFGNSSAPFVSVEPRDSKKADLIQLNDILIGAIGFQKNGYELRASSRYAKKYLANYIAQQVGLRDLKSNTPFSQARFKIWNFKLQK